MRLIISNSTNYNLTGPDEINIKHEKRLWPLAIRYLPKMYNTFLNTDVINNTSLETSYNHSHFKNQTNTVPQHWHKLPTPITNCQNTRENAIIRHNRKYSSHFLSTWIQKWTINTHCFARHLPPNKKRLQQFKGSATHCSSRYEYEQGTW